MATKVKPSRIQITGTPSVGQVPTYVDENTFAWGAGGAGQVSDAAYSPSWDGDTTHAPSKNAVYDKISSIDGLIPSAATSSNQLTDKNYVDDSINSVTAYYITKNAQGDQFANYAELAAATTFYSGGVVRTPTRNDYTIVLDDENHDHATTRYIYNSGWEYQYTVNETALTQAQLDALNSGITAGKVTTYDGYATGKQNTLATQTAYTSKGSATKVPQITTNTLGQVTGITEVTITHPSQVDNTAYASSWDGVTGTAPSKNAVYDKISAMDTTISLKANDSDVVKLTGDQTIAGTKTFSTSPVVPSKTTDATNTGTAIATEAQVYKKQDTLTAGTGISITGTTISATDTSNTKTFYLSSTSDTTTAQAAYDWYLAGKNPIVVYGDAAYILYSVLSGQIIFRSTIIGVFDDDNLGYSSYSIRKLSFAISSDTVTSIAADSNILPGDFLRIGKNYSTPYTPQYNGSPATKKYVDDAIAGVGGGDVLVSSQANNILTSGMKIWAGTQANYESLGTYDNNTVYLTI